MESTARRPQGSVTAGGGTREWWALAVLATAQLMVVLDVTIVNIALPSAQTDLGIPDDQRQWIITAYSLAFGALLVLGGRVGDRWGRKGAFLIGTGGFAVASVLGGAATGFEMLVTARALQGAFAALMAPAALSLVSVIFAGSPHRSKAFGIWGAITGAGGAIGLLLGGVLTEYLSWRWCLYVNVIFALVGALGVTRLVPRSSDPTRPHISAGSAVLVSGGLFGIVYGLSRAETDGWSSALCLTSLTGGVVLVAIFVLVQARSRRPLLPLRVLADRNRAGALVAILLSAAGVFGVFLFLTYFLQVFLGYSAVATGVAFLPMVIALGIVASISGTYLLPRTGPRPVVVVGAVLSGLALVGMTRFDASASYAADVLPPLILAGVGVGLVFSGALAYATYGISDDDAGVGSSLVNTAQQVGGSIGVALLSTQATQAGTDKLTEVLTAAQTMTPTPDMAATATLSGYHAAFWYAAGFFALAAVASGVLFTRRPAARVADPDGAASVSE